MNLQAHELQVQDVPACEAILKNHFSYEHLDLIQVRELFPSWIHNGALKGCVVHDESSVLSFGAAVFISASVADALRTKPKPYLGSEILKHRLFVAPSKTPGPLHIAIIHSGHPPAGATDIETSRNTSLMMQSFLRSYEGYDIAQIFVEAFGEIERSFYIKADFVEVATFSLQHAASNAIPSDPVRSHLFCLSREHVLSLPIHPLLALFTSVTPKCRFNLGEKSLLLHALDGHTDQELAKLLNISPSAIKKRWASIFARAAPTLPELERSADCNGQKRGAQKRHILLSYLRTRPEELR